MSWVLTTQGLVHREDLEVKEVASESDNCRVVATEWHHKGKLVRRDVHCIVLRPLEMGAKLSE